MRFIWPALILQSLLMLYPQQASADILLFEDFASGALPAGWSTTAIQGAATWTVRNAPAFGSTSGTFYAVFDDDILGPGTIPNESDLITPLVDCSNHSTIYLKYTHHWFGVENTYGYVEVSNDGGTIWNTVMTYEKVTRGTIPLPQDTTLNITALAANQANVMVRFRYTDGSQAGKFWYMDDITIYSDPDVGVTDLIDPAYLGCAPLFGTTEPVTVEITNFSILPISNIPVTVNVTGGVTATLSGTYAGVIAPGTTVNFTLPGTVDLSADASYQFECYTTLATDSYLLNDTLITSRRQMVQAYPFLETFDVNSAGWEPGTNNANNYWEWGTAPATYVGGPGGYNQQWRITRDGTSTYSDMWLISPPFDFTTLVSPMLSMELKYDLTYDWCDRAVYVQYSINNGTTWTTLGAGTDPIWYNSGANTCWPNTWAAGVESNWLYVQKAMCNLAGEPCVKFRIYADDVRYDDKFMFDNFRVEEGNDVGVTAYIEPVSAGCGFSANQQVTVEVYNWSCNPISNVPVTCDITGAITQTLTGTVPGPIPADGTVNYTFSTTIDMTGIGTYNFDAYTSLASDPNNSNDTLSWSIVVTNLKIATFPYIEDFELDDGSWLPGGGNATNYWEWNPLPAAYLGGPAGNGSSWRMVRDGSSTYTDMWVESPIFDFSQNTLPVLKFDQKYDLTYDWCDRAVYVQYSLDGGTTWATLGTNADPLWYNSGANTCWPNTWSAGVVNTWTRVRQELCILSGEDCVKLRIYADDVRYDDKFAFDNIEVTDGTGDDLEPVVIFPPDGGACGAYTNAETVAVLVQNNTCRPLENVPITLNMTGPGTATINDTIPGPIPRFSRVWYTFGTTVDMSGTGTYTFTATTSSNLGGVGLSYINDTFPANNTITELRYSNTPINTFPYVADYNTNNQGWASGGSSPIRYFRRDAMPYLSGPMGNGDSYYIESDNSSTYSDIWVQSPVFDFTNMTNPLLSMDIMYDLTYDWCDRAVYVQYSINGGTSWTTLGNINDPMWYNSGGNSCWANTWSASVEDPWINVQHTLCPLVGESCVQFRVYGDDIRYLDRFAFDNFTIRDTVDVGVIAFIEPVDLGCLFSGNQDVTIAVYNWSCTPLADVPVTCDITGPTTTTLNGMVVGPIPPNDSVHYTFPSTFSMTGTGVYNFTAYTTMANDPNNTNDTSYLSINVNQLKVDVFPYTEDFESDDGFWIANGGNATNYWEWNPLPAGYCGGPGGNGNSWRMVRDGSATYTDLWLESPVFDFSQITNPVLKFDQKYDLTYDWCDRAVYVQYSLDGGVTWTTLGTNADPNWYNPGANTCWPNTWSAGIVNTWTRVSHDLCAMSGEPCVKLRIYADDVRYDDKFAVDNVEVTDGTGDDLEPVIIWPPDGGSCTGFTASETIGVLIENNGCRPLTDVPVTFNLTGPNTATLNEVAPGPVPAFGRYWYTFSGTVDMSAAGTYNLSVTTSSNLAGVGLSYINDTFPANNTITESRYANIPINTYPYTATFDADNEGWASGTNMVHRYFDRGVVPYLGGAMGQGSSFYIESNNTSTYSDIWVESPVFDLTGLSNPIMEMDIKYDLTYDWCDRAVYVQYSLDGGTTWTTLGSAADPQWYNSGGNTCWPNTWAAGIDSGWTTVYQSLCNLVGQPCVKFRVYGDDLRYLDKFAFDNFHIEERADLGVIAFIEPVSNNCLQNNPQTVTVEVYNWGCSPVSNVPITCLMTGANTATINEVIAGPIPGGGSVNYTFTTTVDMTAVGNYDFTAYTDLATESNRANDTSYTSVTVNNLLINTFPYTEDFNATSGFGNWTTGTSLSSNYWQWGPLPGGYLGGSATNCWYLVRDGTSTYTDVWVESPVFDFTSVTNPVLMFDIQYDLTYDWCDRAVYVQYSINGGTSWTTLGTNADPNWYNPGTNTCWPNTWSAGIQNGWMNVRHDLCALVGESCVKLRVIADDVRYDDKFAFDNINITDTPIDAELLLVEGCYGTDYDLEVTIFNNSYLCVASPDINTIDLTYSVDGAPPTTVNITGLSIPYGSTGIATIPNVLVPTNASTVQVWCSLPNGLTDQIVENDTVWGNVANWPNCNDHCSEATPIGLGSSLASQNSNATTNVLEDPPFIGCGSPTLENTVWYNFTTSLTGGEVTVCFENIVCTPSSNGIQVSILEFTGAPCDVSNWNELFCANNGNTANFCWGPVILPPNSTYYIAIDGYAGNDCDFDIVLTGQVLVLPVELLHFDANCSENGAALTWSTASEHQNAGFYIERSADGNDFEQIAFVPGQGNSQNVVEYNFLDEDVEEGNWYYRLYQLDDNGAGHYSPITAISCEQQANTIVLKPNPAADRTTLSVRLKRERAIHIHILDEAGRMVWKRSVADSKTFDVDLPVGTFAPGAYTVLVETKTEMLREKLIILR